MVAQAITTDERLHHMLVQGDCMSALPLWCGGAECIFADPPDGIDLGYDEYNDRTQPDEYQNLLWRWLVCFTKHAPIVWFSFNARWTIPFGRIASNFLMGAPDWECKPCVQVFTFGQHNHHDLGNNHRPLWRFKHKDAPLYPDQARVPSWRQLNGDKRADPRGRVPGDVFDYPRVTGNSKQRRKWHPTQLHEDMVRQCILLSTRPCDRVIDPFGGTGTTLRVCQQINRHCTLTELSGNYCDKIAEENGLVRCETYPSFTASGIWNSIGSGRLGNVAIWEKWADAKPFSKELLCEGQENCN